AIGTVSKWPATTTRSSRPASVRATTVSPCRDTSRCWYWDRAASTAAASGFSDPLTDDTSQTSAVRSATERVISRAAVIRSRYRPLDPHQPPLPMSPALVTPPLVTPHLSCNGPAGLLLSCAPCRPHLPRRTEPRGVSVLPLPRPQATSSTLGTPTRIWAS